MKSLRLEEIKTQFAGIQEPRQHGKTDYPCTCSGSSAKPIIIWDATLKELMFLHNL